MPRGKYPRKPRAVKTTKKRTKGTTTIVNDFRRSPSAQLVDSQLSEVERTLYAIVERVSVADVLVQSAARRAADIVKNLRKELYAAL